MYRVHVSLVGIEFRRPMLDESGFMGALRGISAQKFEFLGWIPPRIQSQNFVSFFRWRFAGGSSV
jgi:hypothetical protein